MPSLVNTPEEEVKGSGSSQGSDESYFYFTDESSSYSSDESPYDEIVIEDDGIDTSNPLVHAIYHDKPDALFEVLAERNGGKPNVNATFDGHMNVLNFSCYLGLAQVCQGEKLKSNLSRFVVGVWLFVVLILTSIYTTNLSSLLTVQNFKLTKSDYIGSANTLFRGHVVNNLNFRDDRLKQFQSVDDYVEPLRRGSKNDGVGAILNEMPYIKLFIAKYPAEFTIVETSLTTSGFGFGVEMDMSKSLVLSPANLWSFFGKEIAEG